MTEIGLRLKMFRTRSGTKMHVIAKATGIAKETMYKWEKGTKPSNIVEYFKLKEYLNKMENRLEIEAFEMENQNPATLRLPLNTSESPSPQTDGKAASGTVIFTNGEPELIVDRINAPVLGVWDGCIQVNGHSMEPTFSYGCRIIVSRLSDTQLLNWGHYYYIIDTNWQGFVRRVYQGEKDNTIRLVSDNPDQSKYPPIERSLNQIVAFLTVGASITKF
ncbi:MULTISPECIES: LexA family transcriptional regulator [Niastella]|uniref:LexA family transcriptional regulator n=1 Tax=Niastella soli TaxID=2821487 RepID=A0ABS3Z136_9BACT|nr:LexA family transcriptional regulator [Niastella soli]MBO9203111.1 LexA family transcriptional regulator [Niastella soli]